MDVSNERIVESTVHKRFLDILQILGIAEPLDSDPHIIGPGLDDADNLIYSSFCVFGIRIGHRLDPYRMVPPKGYGAYLHYPGL